MESSSCTGIVMTAVVCASAVLSYFMQSVLCQGTAMMTYNSPVYSGEPVVLTCSYGNDNSLVSVTIDAFSRTQKEGFLWCRVTGHNTTGDGVFRGHNFYGCQTLSAGSTNVSVLMTASPLLELEFNCTALVSHKDLIQYNLTSPTTSLVVHVLPAIPTFAPNPVTFNDGDTAVIRCESRNGKPAAAITLTVALFNGSELAARGIDTASLTLPWPLLDWHNATATCTVTNHKFANMTTTSGILINHISCVRNRESSSHESENFTLDCSTYISSYPAARYIWSGPHKGNSESHLRNAVFTTQLGQSETVNCTATNDIVKKRTLVVITKIDKQASSRQCSLTSMPTAEPYFDKESRGISGELWYILLTVIAISFILTLTITLVILRRRRKLLLKRTKTLGSQMRHPDVGVAERSDVTMLDSVDREYDSLDTQRSSEPVYAQLLLEQNTNSTTLYENFNSPPRPFQHSSKALKLGASL